MAIHLTADTLSSPRVRISVILLVYTMFPTELTYQARQGILVNQWCFQSLVKKV